MKEKIIAAIKRIKKKWIKVEKKVKKKVKHVKEDLIKLDKKKKENIMIWGLIGLLFLVAIGMYNFLLLPQITLTGKKKIVLNYKEAYHEKGYKASFLGDSVTKNVKVKGKVNSSKLGTYKIVYEVKVGVFTKKVTRKVVVKDTSAPSINLADTGDIYVCPGKEYKAEEYKAIDNYDGDITENVKVKQEEDKITYTVADKAGNKKVISRNIIYQDREKPTITLKDGLVNYLFVGDEYSDPLYDVSDNCDSNLQEKVKIDGNVDTSVAGEYILKYSVKDKANNEASVERKIIVSEHDKNGNIYLTFDDGPRDGTTNVILDILKEEGIKATFFVTNSGPDELIKRMYDEGHTVALHTSSHNYATVYASAESFFDDLYSVQDRVKRITGVESKIIRFPGGSSNTISRRYSQGIMSYLTKEVLNRGFKYFDWNITSGDAGETTDSNVVYQNVVNSLRKDRVNVVLMHDIKDYTRDAVRNIIKYGKDNGYTFDKITMQTEMVTQRVNN